MSVEELLELRKHLMASINQVEKELLKSKWQLLAGRGEEILALRAYRQEYGTGLAESRDAVRSFMQML